MSTILDAIRKAEKERSNEAVPSLEAMVQQRRSGRRRNSAGWVVWVALIAVLGAAGYLYQEQLKDWGQSAAGYGRTLVDRTGIDVDSWRDRFWRRKFDMQSVQQTPVASQAVKSGVDPASGGLTTRQRQLLEQLRFDVVSWSRDADKRFVMVGSRTYREGDDIEGFPLQRINPDGVVLSVNGEDVLIRP